MKKFILLYFFFLISSAVNGQTVKVIDKATLKPVKYVKITSSSGKSVSTDILGEANISEFKNESVINFNSTDYADIIYSYSSLESLGFNVMLTEKTYRIDEIVISANRFDESQKDVPRQIKVLNESDIAYSNEQTTADLLEKTGEIFVQRSQLGGGSPILRGFEASRVLIVIDGVRLNNAIFRAGHLQNVIRIDNNMLERTEILYGSGSLMYGSDALGGVVNFYTRNPLLSSNDNALYKGDAFVRYSTADEEKTGHFNINIGEKVRIPRQLYLYIIRRSENGWTL